MYKALLLLSFILFADLAYAQTSSAVLYTENGEQFIALLNDQALNERPVSDLRITGLKEEYYSLKVEFSNRSYGALTFTLALTPGNESTYSIRQNSKGEYALRFIRTAEPGTSTETNPGQQTVEFKDQEKFSASRAIAPTVIVQQETIPESDIEITVMSANADASCETTVTDSTTADVEMLNYKGPVGCSTPLTAVQFDEIRKNINAVDDEAKRMQLAEKNISRHCFYSQQVKTLCELVAFEDSRLELAKQAYANTYDLANYNTVNAVFNFETSVEELNAHIRDSR